MLVRLPSFSGRGGRGDEEHLRLDFGGGGPVGSLFQKTALSISNQSQHDEPIELAAAPRDAARHWARRRPGFWPNRK